MAHPDFGSPLLPARFWSKVQQAEGCWLWTASTDPKGYGFFRSERDRIRRAHIVAWLALRGPIPDGGLLLHQCEFKACVNPEHLRIGSAAENAHERDARGSKTIGVYKGKPWPAFAERFWNKVCKLAEANDCWIWTASCDTNGYGSIMAHGKLLKANRVAWVLTHGPISRDQWVLHRCDNPKCVNPAHLFLGDAASNAQDRAAKGRSYRPLGDLHPSKTHPERVARGDRNGARLYPERLARGSEHHAAKLTEVEVVEILKFVRNGHPIRPLARKYSVSPPIIRHIRDRKIWKHVAVA